MKKLDPRAVWLFFINYGILSFVSSLFFSFWIANILVTGGRLLDNDFGKALLIAFLVFLFLLIFSYFWARLTYHFYRYELRDDVFRKESGVIWKRYVSIPYQRIQNVDIYRGLIARFLGLSDLQIQTAGMSFTGQKGKIAEGRLPGLSKEEAEKVRDELIRRAKGEQGL